MYIINYDAAVDDAAHEDNADADHDDIDEANNDVVGDNNNDDNDDDAITDGGDNYIDTINDGNDDDNDYDINCGVVDKDYHIYDDNSIDETVSYKNNIHKNNNNKNEYTLLTCSLKLIEIFCCTTRVCGFYLKGIPYFTHVNNEVKQNGIDIHLVNYRSDHKLQILDCFNNFFLEFQLVNLSVF